MLHRLLHPLRSPSWTVLPQPLLLPRLVLLVLVCPEGQQLWAEKEDEMLQDWALLEVEPEAMIETSERE